ncbi:hypothetical protein SSX86_018203 [Deinandra increscens subsp. villosa]|uniref:SWIM-type domain-containing protein n=1 Tax=Deinandra increscens subsp. villosa TaxID=3103831 RepID=A0AAP0CUV6_9ASTR
MGGGDHPPDIGDMQIVTSNLVVQEEDYHADVDETMDHLMINHPLNYVGMDKQGTHVSSLYQSPNGSKYWAPQVSPCFKPVVGTLFNDYEEVENMFTAYAEQSGFSARVTAYKKVKDVITHKVMACSKCGKSKAKPIDTLDTATLLNTRASTSHCTDCPALIRYKLIRGDYKVLLYAFSENHNHPMVPSYNMDLTRKGKHLNFDDYQFVHSMSEDIEKHASQIYTLSMFAEVQKEIIRGKNQCYIMNVDVDDGHTVYDVSHMNHLSVYINTFKVRLNNLEDSYECPCLGFTRNGYLCRHIFSVFRVNAVKEIPGRYIKDRWRRQILPPRLYDIPSRLSVENSDLAVMRSEVMECVSVCIDRLSDSLEGMQLFAADINELKNGVVAKYPGKSAANKRAGIMEELIGKVDDVSLGLTPPPHKAYVTKAVAQTRGWLDRVRRLLRSPRGPQGCAGIATHGVITIPAIAKNRGIGRPHLPSSRILALKIP